MQKNFSDSFLKKTIEVWQPRYGHPLTMEDAREIAFNTTALVKYLAKLNEKYGTKPLKTEPEKRPLNELIEKLGPGSLKFQLSRQRHDNW